MQASMANLDRSLVFAFESYRYSKTKSPALDVISSSSNPLQFSSCQPLNWLNPTLFATCCTLPRTRSLPRNASERISLITSYILGTTRLHMRSGLTFISSHLFFKALVGIQPRRKECVLCRSSNSFARLSSSFLSFCTLLPSTPSYIEPPESLITIHSLHASRNSNHVFPTNSKTLRHTACSP